MSTSLKLKNIEYKPVLGLLMALTLAAVVFAGNWYLNVVSMKTSLYGVAIALVIGMLLGFSENTNAPAMGTQALAMASKPTKTSNELETAAKVVQQAAVLLNNIKDSFNSTPPQQLVDYNSVANDLATAITPVLKSHFGATTLPSVSTPPTAAESAKPSA